MKILANNHILMMMRERMSRQILISLCGLLSSALTCSALAAIIQPVLASLVVTVRANDRGLCARSVSTEDEAKSY